MAAFAGESQARNKYTHITHQRQKRMDMFRLQIFLKKQQLMKRNMQKSGLNYYMAEQFHQLWKI